MRLPDATQLRRRQEEYQQQQLLRQMQAQQAQQQQLKQAQQYQAMKEAALRAEVGRGHAGGAYVQTHMAAYARYAVQRTQAHAQAQARA
eukprot:6195200-Pleurochrysis_carterae.AAC.2